MAVKKTTVSALAREANIEDDEALLELWDAGFDKIVKPSDRLERGEANRARRALGLATRRERASEEYWLQLLRVDSTEFRELLATIGVPKPFSGGQLTKRAQHRLTSVARERGVRPTGADQAPTDTKKKSTPPLQWRVIGHSRDCTVLAVDDVLRIHDALVEDFQETSDPISPSGVKSRPLLESAVDRPLTALGSERKYPTVEMGAAALLHALVHNHPFHNGNKRTALVAMLVFLDQNGLMLTAAKDELFKLVLKLAQHKIASGPRNELPDREVLEVAEWLRVHVRVTEKGDRPLPWHQLRKKLTEMGCTCEPAPRGQRMTVSRIVERESRGLLGRKRKDTLKTAFTNVQDGRELNRNTVSKIRSELELDDANGIDAAAFYDEAPVSPSDFIREYQSILRRLARL
ncbi:MAG: type II toxin-antitoxin system death-on-curing family toxin [Gemmatimonadales bacterium]